MEAVFGKPGTSGNVNSLAFTPSFYKWLGRSAGSSNRIEIPNDAEVGEALRIASAHMVLAEATRIEAIRRRNATVFRVIRRGDNIAQWPFIAFLPLNTLGVEAMASGAFDGLCPDPSWIVEAGEAPLAIYVWLVYAPGRMVDGLRLLQALEEIGGGVSLFSRAVNPVSARIQESIGFLPATQFYPDAPSWALVIHPQQSIAPSRPRRPKIKVTIARTIEDVMRVFAVRSATYMSEQFATYEEEYDGNDFCATQLLGTIDGDPAGCARIRYFGDFAKLERLAVRREYRQTRLMFELVRACIDHCREKGFSKLYAHSRADLVPAWSRFGARLIEGKAPFWFADVEYREMYMDVEPTKDAIRFGADPMVLIRPEGVWNRPGPFEQLPKGGVANRAALIDLHARRLRRPDQMPRDAWDAR
ncbi:GNAT family N-acetyltransferase [Sphingobium boeckii]|uniref:GNAT superfamily N-acetyltransferase n=1 Tax=Sphingobium boeckii TaxID=1082345 RepID=A0A7W9AIV0_9SPHN|nr:GNAT family N-acetyltransferase [Sphingobium boeckii]MBB5686482.1 GNAT superfamily N-acetyltransferase [Sphingobium boeckii]